MLTRLHVDNYKSLMNFEFMPPRICVLVGENGSGKTSIGTVLDARHAFVVTRPDGGPTRIEAHDSGDGSMPSEVVLYGTGSEAVASK